MLHLSMMAMRIENDTGAFSIVNVIHSDLHLLKILKCY